MKRVLSLLAAGVLAVGVLVGCDSSGEEEPSSSTVAETVDFDTGTNQTVIFHDVMFEVPESWEYFDAGISGTLVYEKETDSGTPLIFSADFIDFFAPTDVDDWASSLEDATSANEDYISFAVTNSRQYTRSDGGVVTIIESTFQLASTSLTHCGYFVHIAFENEGVTLSLVLSTPVADGNHTEDLELIIDSVEILE